MNAAYVVSVLFEEMNLTKHTKEEHMISSNSLTCSYNKCTEDEVGDNGLDEWIPKELKLMNNFKN